MPFDSHFFLGWTNPTGDFRQVFPHFLGGAEQKTKKKKREMNNQNWVVYGNLTPSDLAFFLDESTAFSSSTSSTLSSTRSDAQSAPPELERVFDRVCEEYTKCINTAGKTLTPRMEHA